MATNTQIHCGCGATLNTSIPHIIESFDALHGNAEHQNLVLQIRKDGNEIRKAKWQVQKNGI
jgi:hypothetical protein